MPRRSSTAYSAVDKTGLSASAIDASEMEMITSPANGETASNTRCTMGLPATSSRAFGRPKRVEKPPARIRAVSTNSRIDSLPQKEPCGRPNVQYRDGGSIDESREEVVAEERRMDSVEAVLERFAGQQYIADRSIGMAVYLALRMGKPLLVEGEPGCGKTEIARTLATALDTNLIRLQCYEGHDADSTLYEWNHPKQLLTIRIEESRKDPKALEKQIFNEEFEGLLLEFLSDFQITIPEIGTIHAKRVPHVVITSNRTRELSDALKRRCLYLYIGYPSREKEITILRSKVPGLHEQFAEEIAGFIQRVRAQDDFVKHPGISETLEWASALMTLGTTKLDRDIVEQTLGFVVKDAQDLQTMQSGRLDALLGSP